MNRTSKRWILAGGGVAAVAVIVAGTIVLWPNDSRSATTLPTVKPLPAPIAQQFAAALMAGNAAQAASVTDNTAVAQPAIEKMLQGMKGVTYGARIGASPAVGDDTTSATLSADVTWTLPDSTPLKYAVPLELRRSNDKWQVHWTPALLHPDLAEGQSLAYSQTSGDGAVLDRNGTAVPPGFAPVVMSSVTKTMGSAAGEPGWQVAAVDAAGTPVSVLAEKKAKVRQPMTLTLDPPTQNAAQGAVDQVQLPAVVVALAPSNGEILAVAQNTAASAGGPISLQNYYEPGSTFKIVTATAALMSGNVTADTPVECPGKKTIGPRQIVNDEQFDLGTVPVHRAFAASCNTSFSQLAADLPATALPQAASLFGLGADYTVAGLTTNTGKVPPSETVTQRVEAGIGQGTMQTTPFGMALAAATVAKGSTPTPQLIREIPTEGGQGRALPGGVVSALRSMMGEVVTGGTAQALAGLGGVRGKTGTAQHGDGTSSHGWFVGYRGDLAFAVLVVDAGTSKVAVSTTANFLGAL
ncbi:penicillin-binding transpeptidase domain-containing protein [Actinosynnema sp. NPDC047251]|uniref:Peptidoglycan synthetase n=1 Tax=Saccharothrix espanaensis (strain ATCC 51144 / DSM 44229 / JCM 9112 / NBRC 15066 / NRRL 15764) TaxID=1179773 RepID=K0K577_SACES|nr:penicillin-binding transpeptidase domain-containing protein [Saccharothrix espanaensis]CCH33456.1 Peptidoglycan synthetase [Saccharothrix espanaensis DSM 44229]